MTLPYQTALKKKTKSHYRLTLETKLYPVIFLLERIYIVLVALPQKQICHNLKRPGEEESKIIGDIGIKSLLFKVRFGLSV